MTFNLTKTLYISIIEALENQKENFVLDAKTQVLIKLNEENKKEIEEEEGRFYPLPLWDNEAGYKLRSDFVLTLHSSIIKIKLNEALHNGRGAFHSFRQILRQHEGIDKLWHKYKQDKMGLFIDKWYNKLCDLWGCEHIIYKESEDYDNFLLTDFTFKTFILSPTLQNDCDIKTYKKIKEVIDNIETNEIFTCENEKIGLQDSVKNVMKELVKEQFYLEYGKVIDKKGSVLCATSFSLAQDLIAFITLTIKEDGKGKNAILTSMYVKSEYREVGLATNLLNLLKESVKKEGIKGIIVASGIVNKGIESLLNKAGFIKCNNIFVSNLKEIGVNNG